MTQLDRIEAMLRYLFDNSKACYHNQPYEPRPISDEEFCKLLLPQKSDD